jgi:dolichol kinase
MLEIFRLPAVLAGLLLMLVVAGPANAITVELGAANTSRAQLWAGNGKVSRAPGNALMINPRGQPGEFSTCTDQRPMMRWNLATKLDFWRAGFVASLPSFLLSEAVIALAFFLSMFGLGTGVRKWKWNANYTRKLLGAVMLATPIVIGTWVPYAANPQQIVVSFLLFLVFLALFAEPIRAKSPFLQTAFASIDRPEDRPHTLTWFITAYVVSSILLLTMMWWAVPGQPAFVFVAFAAVAVGDLLAGAVGHRFGRHRYATAALFTSKTYTRSIEGSACVFVTTAIAVLFVGATLPFGQFVAALIVLPIALTLAEAKSPHTWDEPVMFATAMLISLAIVHVWQASVC